MQKRRDRPATEIGAEEAKLNQVIEFLKFRSAREMKTIMIYAAIFAIILGLIIATGSVWLFLSRTTELNSNAKIEPSIFAYFGSLVSGTVGILFSLAGIFLLLAIWPIKI